MNAEVLSEVLTDGSGFVKNVKIFGVDMSSSGNVYNRKKISLVILAKGPRQGLDDTTLTSEKNML